MSCYCGREQSLRFRTISTFYEGVSILARHVPVYICNEEHISLSRKTRIRLKEQLKTVFEKNEDHFIFNRENEDSTSVLEPDFQDGLPNNWSTNVGEFQRWLHHQSLQFVDEEAFLSHFPTFEKAYETFVSEYKGYLSDDDDTVI